MFNKTWKRIGSNPFPLVPPPTPPPPPVWRKSLASLSKNSVLFKILKLFWKKGRFVRQSYKTFFFFVIDALDKKASLFVIDKMF